MKQWLCVALLGICCAFEPPATMFALLKNVYAASLFSMYAPRVGYLYCSLYGVQAPIYTQPDMSCQIDPKKAQKMRWYAKTFTQRTIFLEQKYRLGYADGYCFVQDGAHLFNATIIREGFGVYRPMPKVKGDNLIKDELQQLEDIARANRKGLWGDYAKEMECLRKVARERPAGIEKGY